MTRVIRAFPALCALSLTLPFLAGWAITGTLYGGLTAFLWADLIRIALLQHVTWSVNSLCHVIGSRPFKPAATTAPPVTSRHQGCHAQRRRGGGLPRRAG
jgi:fatty-acid desaturase